METIELISCDSANKANLIRSRLADEGIESFTTNENYSNLMPHHANMIGGGIQIMIRKVDYQRAVLILNPDAKFQKEISCPHCQSKDVRFGSGSNIRTFFLMIIISLVFWMPHTKLKNKYFCHACRRDFTV